MSTFTSTQLPVIRSLDEAEQLCHDFDAVITAGPERNEVDRWGHKNHLVVSFDDTDNLLNPVAPRLAQISKIVEWGVAQTGSLLVHCHAGISRSTACAWGITIGKGFDPTDALVALRLAHPPEGEWGSRPFAPNLLIVAHLEEIFALPNLTQLVNSIS